MKPSLLAIVFLTGTVYSKGLWSVFDAFFGKKVNSNELNVIPDDDENRHHPNSKQENSAEGVGSQDGNDILHDVNPYTQEKIKKPIDNRVGYIRPIKHDARTEEGYRKGLEQGLEYLRNLSTQDNGLGEGAGPAYTQLHLRFGAYDENENFYWDDGFGDDGDDGYYPDDDGDMDFDYDFGDFGHDEFK